MFEQIPSLTSFLTLTKLNRYWLSIISIIIVWFMFSLIDKKTSDIIEKAHNIDMLVNHSKKDSIIADYKLREYEKIIKESNDSTTKNMLNLQIVEERKNLISYKLQNDTYQSELNELLTIIPKIAKESIVYTIILIMFLSIGYFSFLNVTKDIISSRKARKYCQSCGKEFNGIYVKNGIEINGSNSPYFCTKCYNNGAFINETITIDEMAQKITIEMDTKGIPQKEIRKKVKSLNSLARWKLLNKY